ncbi:hypothetical protein PCL_02308 [Purpureocillium lilacinum]|uniref:Uncharacterized protein n=1 Tax=Purpureocillium lilacinum TaxID=33203 RepID=A0A2U3E091_PURLI|nr:hypothetical protein PCL_02308 [Purpureocillium lilacinum]
MRVLVQQQPGAGAAQAFRYHATGSQIRGKRLRSSNMTVSSALSMSLPSGRIALQGPGVLPGVGGKAAPWRDWISRARDQTDGENKRVLAVETGTLTRHFLRFGRWGTPRASHVATQHQGVRTSLPVTGAGMTHAALMTCVSSRRHGASPMLTSFLPLRLILIPRPTAGFQIEHAAEDFCLCLLHVQGLEDVILPDGLAQKKNARIQDRSVITLNLEPGEKGGLDQSHIARMCTDSAGTISGSMHAR